MLVAVDLRRAWPRHGLREGAGALLQRDLFGVRPNPSSHAAIL